MLKRYGTDFGRLVVELIAFVVMMERDVTCLPANLYTFAMLPSEGRFVSRRC